MIAKYILSPLAAADIDDIWEFSAARWGEQQADDYTNALRNAIEAAAMRPSRGRACNDIREGYFRLSSGSHIIFFQKLPGQIDIKRVLHQSMDFDRHL